MTTDTGRVTGSREPSPISVGLGPSGFDPARLAALMDEVDRAAVRCPVRGKGWRGVDCPKCHAGDKQPCGSVLSAEYEVLRAVRQMIVSHNRATSESQSETADQSASAGEAQRAETTKIGSVHEHATGVAGDAQ